MILWANEWKTKILSFNRNIKLFMLANVLLQSGLGVYMVMYNLYIKELGLPETVNGNVISMTATAAAIMLIPAGFLSDKFGRKWMLLGGAAAAAITLFYRSFAISETQLVAAAFFTGLFMAFVQVSGIPFLAEHSKSSERVHLFSVYFALMTLANVAGSLLGGAVSDIFQWLFSMEAVFAIRWALFVGALLYIAGLVPLLYLDNKPPASKEKVKTRIEINVADAGLKKNLAAIFHFSFASLLIGFGSGLVVPYLNLYFANRFDASNSYIGLILASGSAMTVVAMLIGPVLVAKVGKVNAMLLFQLLSIPFLILTAYTTSLLLASLGFLLRQALMNAGNPIQSAIAMEVVHDKYKGLANSANQVVFNIGWATMGPVAAGLVISFGSYWGYAYAFSITSVLYLISAIYFYFIFGKRKLQEQ